VDARRSAQRVKNRRRRAAASQSGGRGGVAEGRRGRRLQTVLGKREALIGRGRFYYPPMHLFKISTVVVLLFQQSVSSWSLSRQSGGHGK